MNNKLIIGVTGTGSLIGQAIIKSIKKSKFNESSHIIGFDYFSNTVGSFWCDKNIRLPDLLKGESILEEWKAVIVNTIIAEKISVLFIGVDFELKYFAQFKTEIETKTGAIVIVSPSNVIEIADDKYLTYLFLKENGLYYPKTYLPHEIDNIDVPFPLIVKPRIGARSRGVHVVKNYDEMLHALNTEHNPIVQELVGDNSTEFTCGVLFWDNENKGIIPLKRQLKEGNTFIAEYSNDFPEIIYKYVNDIAVKLKPFGACNFQLRVDKEGIPKLFEINSRHSGTTYMRALFGFNEVELIIKYLTNEAIRPLSLKEGKVVRYFDEFFVD